MMEKEKKDALYFGYALSVVIPLITLVFPLKEELGKLFFFLILAGSIGLLFTAVTKLEKSKTLYFACLIAIYTFLIWRVSYLGINLTALVFNGAAVLVLLVSIFKIEWLVPFHKKWTALAQFLGNILLNIIMTVIFILVFTPVGIVLRILKKDFLNRKLEPEAKTYWIKREEKEFDPESYKRQF